MSDSKTPAGEYYDEAWRVKLARPEYATLDRRWRSRWDYVAEQVAPGSRVLDVGCGDGILGERLMNDLNCTVVGVDVSSHALELAAKRGVEGQVIDIDVDPLPFPSGEFDAVVASCVLEHVAHPDHVLREAHRVLAPNGLMYLTLPNPLTWKIRLAFVAGRFHPDFLHSRPGEGIHYRFWPVVDGLERMLAESQIDFNVQDKRVELKNPKIGSSMRRSLKRVLIRARPSLFGEYVHFSLRKSGD